MAILFVGTKPPFWARRLPAVCQALGSGLCGNDRGSPSFPSCSVGTPRLQAEGSRPSLSHTAMTLESGTQNLQDLALPCLQEEASVV